MDIVEQITEWLNDLEDKSVFLVTIDWKPGNKRLSVLLDGDEGISIEQCRKANRLISSRLDEAEFTEEHYILEVSSPGADKPLVLNRQYPKHIGRELEVRLQGESVIIGKLQSVDEDKIVLKLQDQKKRYTDQCKLKEIDWADIKESKVIISFK